MEYQIYFGDGVLGKSLTDGNQVIVSYITTSSTASYGANNFVLMDTIAGYSNTVITPITSTTTDTTQSLDVVVNNAFDGPPQESWANFGQVNVLEAVYDKWKQAGKSGYIFNIGSVGEKHVVAREPGFETYRVAKAALAHASKQCTASFKANVVPFKTTLITLDRLRYRT